MTALRFEPLHRPARPLDGRQARRLLRDRPYASGPADPSRRTCAGCGAPHSGTEYCPTPNCVRGQQDSRQADMPARKLTPVAGMDREERPALALRLGRWPFEGSQRSLPGGGPVAPWLRDRGAEYR